MSTISYPHLSMDDEGVAFIGRTRYKVLHLAAEHYHLGWSAEELLRQHTDLKPEEVYSAITFFYDHHNELVEKMRQQSLEVERHRSPTSLTRDDLLGRREEAS